MLLKERYGHTIAVLIALCLSVAFQVKSAEAHWNMEPRFWADESKKKFFLSLHNKADANRDPVKEKMEVCFWIEEVRDNIPKRISEKRCIKFVMKPNEFKTLDFELKETYFSFKRGNYRAVAMARQRKSRFVKFFMGAALAKLYADFDVK